MKELTCPRLYRNLEIVPFDSTLLHGIPKIPKIAGKVDLIEEIDVYGQYRRPPPTVDGAQLAHRSHADYPRQVVHREKHNARLKQKTFDRLKDIFMNKENNTLKRIGWSSGLLLSSQYTWEIFAKAPDISIYMMDIDCNHQPLGLTSTDTLELTNPCCCLCPTVELHRTSKLSKLVLTRAFRYEPSTSWQWGELLRRLATVPPIQLQAWANLRELHLCELIAPHIDPQCLQQLRSLRLTNVLNTGRVIRAAILAGAQLTQFRFKEAHLADVAGVQELLETLPSGLQDLAVCLRVRGAQGPIWTSEQIVSMIRPHRQSLRSLVWDVEYLGEVDADNAAFEYTAMLCPNLKQFGTPITMRTRLEKTDDCVEATVGLISRS